MVFITVLLLAASLQAAAPSARQVKEPDWNAWASVDKASRQSVANAWTVLREFRPEKSFASEDQRAALSLVNDAYKSLGAHKEAACAAGADLLHATLDDWERLMIASTIADLDPSRGQPFLLWAMATTKNIEASFQGLFPDACRLAGTRRLEVLPALAAMLRVRDASIRLPVSSWDIPTHEALFYIYGHYGRDAIGELRPALNDADPYVRRNAAFVLGQFMDVESKPRLMQMVSASDESANGATFALGELGVAEAVAPVIERLQRPDPRARFWAAWALFGLGSPKALPALKQAAAKESDAIARGQMQAAIQFIEGGADPLPKAAKLSRAALNAALEAAQAGQGWSDLAAIAVSAGPEDLDRLERLRDLSMQTLSEEGNTAFKQLSLIIKLLRRQERVRVMSDTLLVRPTSSAGTQRTSGNPLGAGWPDIVHFPAPRA
jgi:hypothetical protein